jgi:hypothetical protein
MKKKKHTSISSGCGASMHWQCPIVDSSCHASESRRVDSHGVVNMSHRLYVMLSTRIVVMLWLCMQLMSFVVDLARYEVCHRVCGCGIRRLVAERVCSI